MMVNNEGKKYWNYKILKWNTFLYVYVYMYVYMYRHKCVNERGFLRFAMMETSAAVVWYMLINKIF